MGQIESSNNESVTILNPYQIYDLGKGPCVMPLEMHLLMEPMKDITLRMFDIMWNKKLSDFQLVHKQYIQATTGIEVSTEQIIL